MDFIFDLLEVNADKDLKWIWFDLFYVNIGRWFGSLLYIGYIRGKWEFDFLFLRELCHKLKQKLDDKWQEYKNTI